MIVIYIQWSFFLAYHTFTPSLFNHIIISFLLYTVKPFSLLSRLSGLKLR